MTEASHVSCMLVIENGPQAGASVGLPRGTYCVGRDIASDIIIADDTLEDRHFEIEVEDGLYLSSLSGALHDENGRLLRQGRKRRLDKAFRVQAGRTSFRLVPGASASITRRRSRQRIASAAGLLLACAAGLMFIFSPTAKPSSLVSLARTAHPVLVTKHEPAAIRERQPDPSAAVHAFADELKSVGLSGISVLPAGQGAIAADGSIDSSQSASWDAARRWFDGAFGADFVLINRLSPTKYAAPLSVVAAWSGPEPYVIDQQGEKLLVGTVLPTGWHIAAIHSDRLLLSRAGQLLVIRF